MKTYKLQITIKEGGTELEKNISLEAENPSELSQKINAIKILSESVNHEKPQLIPVVKNMIDEGENLSETQMMVRLPKYVKQVLRVLKN